MSKHCMCEIPEEAGERAYSSELVELALDKRENAACPL